MLGIRNKGLTLAHMPAIAIAFVVGGIILGLGAYTNSQVQTFYWL